MGSPAHAGIDLSPSHQPSKCGGFPRTRGDRPLTANTAGSRRSWGSPAHAGIDPNLSLILANFSRFPRTRGDRPVTHARVTRQGKRFPRTRGDRPLWRYDTSALHTRLGSPAHAGIDPRGDAFRPLIVDRYQRPMQGSPAHAGIDPLEHIGEPSRYVEVPPHTRG